ncbi:tRNA (guanine-N(7)-)-methyltransferase non-catalytic subunit wdr4 [Ostrinia furnacalis]|uniref:tRNA (guanine-N(7)-)-methyltransferase non-catalytic subunit wdr4 n=1 Tax=Ostrinia furnacalis TaxID=93504 RepID=UPI00103BF13E|nr:tRNA (guanine-N(7)-)-methyltransferase non-catalytic subunit wdr4 [Ostrinia furnacalis]
MNCLAVSDNFLAISKGLHVDCYSTQHNFFNVPCKSESQENDRISDIAIAPDEKHLAIITSVSKQLLVCNLPGMETTIAFTLPRSASKIRFTANNSHVLVADKSGDVLIYDITDEDSGTKLLGHLSILLDVLQTNDGKYIISSDRDEKIRVSCFPNTYNIQTYCLGHREFVNHIEILPHSEKYLTSASGDGTVKCWDYVTGALCHNINAYLDVDDVGLKEHFAKIMDEEGVEVTTLPIVHYTATALDEDTSVLAIAIHGYNKLLIYSLETRNKQFLHKKEDSVMLERFPAAIKFHKSSLFVYDDVDNTVCIIKIVWINSKLNFECDKKLTMFINVNVNGELNSSIDAIKVLYKRKFDNVQEYQERKKQRLEKVSQ